MYSIWSRAFAALTNRKLIGLKVTFMWAGLHTSLHYLDTSLLCNVTEPWTQIYFIEMHLVKGVKLVANLCFCVDVAHFRYSIETLFLQYFFPAYLDSQDNGNVSSLWLDGHVKASWMTALKVTDTPVRNSDNIQFNCQHHLSCPIFDQWELAAAVAPPKGRCMYLTPTWGCCFVLFPRNHLLLPVKDVQKVL